MASSADPTEASSDGSTGGRREPHAEETSPAGAGAALTVSAVARRLGVAPATLRTWDRRYGLGPSAHTAGAHRRYTPADLSRLTVMRKLTLQGVSPGEAARVVQGGEVAVSGAPDGGPMHEQTASYPDWAIEPESTPTATPLRNGAPDVAARGLFRAAMALDPRACADIINAALDQDGVVATWDTLLVPVLIRVGDRWSRTGEGIDVEHLLSECVMGVMRAATDRLAEPANDRPVLLACAEDENHGLVLHVLAAALSERRIACRLLGTQVPRQALAAAIRRLGPAAAFVWAQLPDSGNGEQLRDLPGLRPRPALLVGGPGWDLDSLPEGIRTAGRLEDAVDLLVAATGN